MNPPARINFYRPAAIISVAALFFLALTAWQMFRAGYRIVSLAAYESPLGHNFYGYFEASNAAISWQIAQGLDPARFEILKTNPSDPFHRSHVGSFDFLETSQVRPDGTLFLRLLGDPAASLAELQNTLSDLEKNNRIFQLHFGKIHPVTDVSFLDPDLPAPSTYFIRYEWNLPINPAWKFER